MKIICTVDYWQVGNELDLENDEFSPIGYSMTFRNIKNVIYELKDYYSCNQLATVIGLTGISCLTSQSSRNFLKEMIYSIFNPSGLKCDEFDFVDAHLFPYPNPVNNFQSQETEAELSDSIEDIKNILNSRGCFDAEIWITEHGTYSDRYCSLPYDCYAPEISIYEWRSDLKQARHYIKQIVIALSHNVKKINCGTLYEGSFLESWCLFQDKNYSNIIYECQTDECLEDDVYVTHNCAVQPFDRFDQSGIITDGRSRFDVENGFPNEPFLEYKLAYKGIKFLNKYLCGLTFQKKWVNNSIYGFTFNIEGIYRVILWSNNNQEITFDFQMEKSPGYYLIYNIFNETWERYETSEISPNIATITIDDNPIMLEYVDENILWKGFISAITFGNRDEQYAKDKELYLFRNFIIENTVFGDSLVKTLYRIVNSSMHTVKNDPYLSLDIMKIVNRICNMLKLYFNGDLLPNEILIDEQFALDLQFVIMQLYVRMDSNLQQDLEQIIKLIDFCEGKTLQELEMIFVTPNMSEPMLIMR